MVQEAEALGKSSRLLEATPWRPIASPMNSCSFFDYTDYYIGSSRIEALTLGAEALESR